MELPVAVRRVAYRVAYALLRVYWLVFQPQTRGVKCLLTHGDRLLLVRHTYGNRDWDLPGGGIRRNEPPVAAAEREMLEELGVTVHDWHAVGQVGGRLDHHEYMLYCFQADLQEPELELDRGEIATADWFSKQELPNELGRYAREVLATVELT